MTNNDRIKYVRKQ